MDVKDYEIMWLDSGREPKCAPDPRFPEGIDIDERDRPLAGRPACKFPLPYPAPRCGAYLVQCNRCGYSIAVTTAGRPDDPKSVTVHCKPN